MTPLRDRLLRYIFVLLLIALLCASYYRFFVLRDYYVSYEIPCDPYASECFVWCEDIACEEESYYLVVERKAHDIYALCGSDITDCEESPQCTEDEEECSVITCSQENETCDMYQEEDFLREADDPELLIDEQIP